MKDTIRRWVTYIKEDKIIKRLMMAVVMLLCISVAAFILKGPKTTYSSSKNPADHFVHEKPGITNIKSPAVIMLCGMPMMMIEPSDDGSTTIFGGAERVKERLKQIPEAPIIVTELSKSYQGLSCEGLFGIPGESLGPSSGTPTLPQAIPPGYKWSA